MPLNPIKLSKSANRDDNRILPGRIVEYEQHGKIIIATALSESKGKWTVLNQAGAEVHLPAARLYLLPEQLPDSCKDQKSKASFLANLADQSAELSQNIELEPVWEILNEQAKEVDTREIVELIFSSDSLTQHLATRLALLHDRIYFRRKKQAFEPRSSTAVEELKVKAQREDQQRNHQQNIIDQGLLALKTKSPSGFSCLSAFEDLAALGKGSSFAKDYREILETIWEQDRSINQGKMPAGKLEAKAFEFLVRIGHFNRDQNLMPIKLGRPLEFSPESQNEIESVCREIEQASGTIYRDRRDLFTVTIDGAETKDFDDALSAEETNNGWLIGIHISDVAQFIKPGSALEQEAFRRATSIYCPDQQIPMLPPEISENTLSLIEGATRPVLSMYVEMSSDFCDITRREIHRELITIEKRLTYEQADDLLCNSNALESKLATTLDRLWNASSASETRRLQAGALQLNRREMYPRFAADGKIMLEEPNEDNPSRKLVSELMILANETAALYGRKHSLPLVFRGQEAPDVDIELETQNIPNGPAREYYRRGFLKRSLISYQAQTHFGLGLEAYIQATSPIRRGVDLLNQRQLGSHISSGTPFYNEQELSYGLAQFDLGLEEASQIQRNRTRYWLLKYLQQEKITELDAVIIKVDTPRPLAELDILHFLYPFHPIAPKGSEQNFIGKQVRLKLDSIDPRQDTLVLREVQK